jgi:hypothetical protein
VRVREGTIPGAPVSAFWDPKRFSLRDAIAALKRGAYGPVEAAAIGTDDKGPARRMPAAAQHAVSPSDLFRRVAENRVVETERPGKLLIRPRSIGARAKVSHIETAQVVTAPAAGVTVAASERSWRDNLTHVILAKARVFGGIALAGMPVCPDALQSCGSAQASSRLLY